MRFILSVSARRVGIVHGLNAGRSSGYRTAPTRRATGAPTWQAHRRVVIPHARPGIAVGCIMTFILSAGSSSVRYTMTRGTAAARFTRFIHNRIVKATSWKDGAAHALSLLASALCSSS